jgi:hypothetical protein
VVNYRDVVAPRGREGQALGGGRGETYEALVFGEQHGDAGIDLADGEGDEHCVVVGICVRCCLWTVAVSRS